MVHCILLRNERQSIRFASDSTSLNKSSHLRRSLLNSLGLFQSLSVLPFIASDAIGRTAFQHNLSRTISATFGCIPVHSRTFPRIRPAIRIRSLERAIRPSNRRPVPPSAMTYSERLDSIETIGLTISVNRTSAVCKHFASFTLQRSLRQLRKVIISGLSKDRSVRSPQIKSLQ